MKTTNKFLLAAAVVAIFSLTLTSKAGEILRSPRAAGNQPKVAAVSQADDLDQLHPFTGRYVFAPRTVGNRLMMAIGTTPLDPDLIRNYRAVVYTGKAPGRENGDQMFDVAPLK